MKLDMVVAGVQGVDVIALVEVFAKAALLEGFDVHCYDDSASAFPGASSLFHVRVGTPAGPSPRIPMGTADIAVGLEKLEAVRLARFLAPKQAALLSDRGFGLHGQPFRLQQRMKMADMEAAFSGHKLYLVPAVRMARSLGGSVLANAVMLGAIAGANPVVEKVHIVTALRQRMANLADLAADAFFEGYKFITGSDQ